MKFSVLSDDVWTSELRPEITLTYGAMDFRANREYHSIMARFVDEHRRKGGTRETLNIAASTEMIDHIIKYGVRDVTGCEIEIDGKIKPLKLKFKTTRFGKCLTDESYGKLYPFLEGEEFTLSLLIVKRLQTG